MQMLTINVATPGSARALHAALSDFRTKRVELEDGGYQVEVALGNDRQIVDVLNAIELYVTRRRDGPARIGFNGHSYSLHPDPLPADRSEVPTPFSWGERRAGRLCG